MGCLINEKKEAWLTAYQLTNSSEKLTIDSCRVCYNLRW